MRQEKKLSVADKALRGESLKVHAMVHGFALVAACVAGFVLSTMVKGPNGVSQSVVCGSFSIGIVYIYSMLATSFYIRRVSEADRNPDVVTH